MDKSMERTLGKSMRKGIRIIPPIAWIIVLCILCLCFLAYSINFKIYAQSTGGMIGASAGELAGRAMGSLEGLTKGQHEGYEAGRTEGLSAKDTTASLANSIKEGGKLEVLVASGTYSDILKIGEKPVDYAVLLSQKYNAVFSIDLKTASIELKEDGLHILLDQPTLDFFPVGETEKKNEFQRGHYRGSTEEGYIAADNSMNEICRKAQEYLQSNESLLTAAKNSAETQLTQLVAAMSLEKPEVIVDFRGGD